MKIYAPAALLCAILPSFCAAQTGLLVVAHGADSGWDARVAETVRAVRWNGPVELAFLMGAHAGTQSLGASSERLVAAGAKRMVVVPLMVSSWGAHVREIEAAVSGARSDSSSHAPMMDMPEMTGARMRNIPARVTGALDAAPELGEALLTRWLALPLADRHRPLVLVAHGPDTDIEAARWVANITRASAELATHLPDHVVHVGLLRDDAPPPMRAAAVASIRDTINALAAMRGRDSVMVMTVLVSSGAINNTVVPVDLAGLPMHYSGTALAPHAALARWIVRAASAVRW